MKKNFGRILVLAALVALIGALVISTAAFAAGSGQQFQAQNGNGYHGEGPGDCICDGPCDGTCDCEPILKCEDLNEDGICGRP